MFEWAIGTNAPWGRLLGMGMGRGRGSQTSGAGCGQLGVLVRAGHRPWVVGIVGDGFCGGSNSPVRQR
jgi:hypothetical protein